MISGPKSGSGYALSPHELSSQVTTLSSLGDRAEGLVSSANRLAQQSPKLGTAPPAMHLAMRLQEAAGETGLTGEVTAASTELTGFHDALRQTVANYVESEDTAARSFQAQHEDGPHGHRG